MQTPKKTDLSKYHSLLPESRITITTLSEKSLENILGRSKAIINRAYGDGYAEKNPTFTLRIVELCFENLPGLVLDGESDNANVG